MHDHLWLLSSKYENNFLQRWQCKQTPQSRHHHYTKACVTFSPIKKRAPSLSNQLVISSQSIAGGERGGNGRGRRRPGRGGNQLFPPPQPPPLGTADQSQKKFKIVLASETGWCYRQMVIKNLSTGTNPTRCDSSMDIASWTAVARFFLFFILLFFFQPPTLKHDQRSRIRI